MGVSIIVLSEQKGGVPWAADSVGIRPCAFSPQNSAGVNVGQFVPGVPYLHSRCMEWTPTFQTRPSGRPADACAGDSGRRRVSGLPERSVVSSGVLWTVGSGTTPGTRGGP